MTRRNGQEQRRLAGYPVRGPSRDPESAWPVGNRRPHRPGAAALLAMFLLAAGTASSIAQIERPMAMTKIRPVLKVRQYSGDMARWVTALPVETMQTQPTYFSWTNPLADIASADWQLSDRLIPPANSALDAPGTLATGSCAVPEATQGKIFTIDLSAYLPPSPPAQPTTYYVRVVAMHSGEQPPSTSNAIALTYRKPSGRTTTFTAEGLEQTVKQKQAWMYNSSPMPIQIDLEKLAIGNENEGGDEPYLMIYIVYVDGMTINPLDLANSTVRVQCSAGTHGNVPDEDVWGKDLDTGKTARIPPPTGHHEATIKPVGLEFAADLPDYDGSIGKAMRDHTTVHLIVVAMEEDATSTSAANAAHSTACQGLQERANQVVQGMTLADLRAGNVQFDPTQIRQQIQDAAIEAAVDETLIPGWWLPQVAPLIFVQGVDPDDFVGGSHRAFSFGDLLDAGEQGIDFTVTLSNSQDWEGSYTVYGRIGRR